MRTWLHPILTPEEALSWETRLLGEDEARTWEAMTAAGRALGAAIWRDFPEAGTPANPFRVLLLAGKGHNAGDGLVALKHLAESGIALEVDVVAASEPGALRPLTSRALRGAVRALGGALHWRLWSPRTAELLQGRRWDLCLDGLLGMRFRPPLRDPGGAILRWVANAADRVRFRAAIDLPSGVGEGDGFHADATYATGICKSPLTEAGASSQAGRIRYLDIGFFDAAVPDGEAKEWVVHDGILDALRRVRPADSEKRTYGRVLVVGGSRAMPGAVLMAARAAVRGGAGLVTVAVPGRFAGRLAGACPEAMWLPMPELPGGQPAPDSLALLHEAAKRADAMVVGPGMDTDFGTRQLIVKVVRDCHLPTVVDASGLYPEVVASALARPERSGPVVVTPHLGEYARLLRRERVRYDRDALLEFCRRHRVISVLKGPFTRVCDGSRICFCPAGGPLLARGGSGDILAGLIGARLAGGASGSALEETVRAVYWHGAAADSLARRRGAVAVATTDLLDGLADALRA